MTANERDIYTFFAKTGVGKIRDVRLIRDQRSGKSKGYVHFRSQKRWESGRIYRINIDLRRIHPFFSINILFRSTKAEVLIFFNFIGLHMLSFTPQNQFLWQWLSLDNSYKAKQS